MMKDSDMSMLANPNMRAVPAAGPSSVSDSAPDMERLSGLERRVYMILRNRPLSKIEVDTGPDFYTRLTQKLTLSIQQSIPVMRAMNRLVELGFVLKIEDHRLEDTLVYGRTVQQRVEFVAYQAVVA